MHNFGFFAAELGATAGDELLPRHSLMGADMHDIGYHVGQCLGKRLPAQAFTDSSVML